jgi:hypothetical protein
LAIEFSIDDSMIRSLSFPISNSNRLSSMLTWAYPGRRSYVDGCVHQVDTNVNAGPAVGWCAELGKPAWHALFQPISSRTPISSQIVDLGTAII